MIYHFINVFLFILSLSISNFSRDPRRPIDHNVPMIVVSSTDQHQEKTWAARKSSYLSDKSHYVLRNNFLQLKPIMHGFNQEFFTANYLPNDIITFRDKTGIVSSEILSNLASEVVEEIKVGQRHFTHFKILKDKDFNYDTLSGLIILKYKDYPFVIKISIEHPHSIVQPFSKSIEATGIFVVGGNLRHLSNFTRISNLQKIKHMLSYNPFYLQCMDFPRKWYWAPKDIYQLKIEWHWRDTTETVYLPSIYATISDFIYTEEQQPQNELNKLSMKVTTDVGFLIDPHAGNILIEQGTRKYVLLDTEDFRLMTGLNANMNATKYVGWYIELVNNALKSLYGRSKKERIEQATRI